MYLIEQSLLPWQPKFKNFILSIPLPLQQEKFISLTDFLFKFLLSCSYNVLISDRVVLLGHKLPWKRIIMTPKYASLLSMLNLSTELCKNWYLKYCNNYRTLFPITQFVQHTTQQMQHCRTSGPKSGTGQQYVLISDESVFIQGSNISNRMII